MSTQFRAFRPLAPTQNIAVTATAQSLALTNTVGNSVAVRFANIGTQTVFVTFDNTVATATNGVPLPAGQVEAFTITTQYPLSVIAAGTGSTLYVTVGEGL